MPNRISYHATCLRAMAFIHDYTSSPYLIDNLKNLNICFLPSEKHIYLGNSKNFFTKPQRHLENH